LTLKGFRRPIQQNRPSEDIVCKNEIKNQDGKIRHCLSDEYFGKSGTKLTTEIEDGLHIYTTYSKQGLKQAYSEYLTLFESK